MEEKPVNEQGVVYAAFVEDELKWEHGRRTSIDSRALSVITTSGVLVTLLFGVAALVTGRRDAAYSPAPAVVVLSGCGLVLFVIAAALGILASKSVSYSVIDGASLEKLRTEHWGHDAPTALNVVMWYRTNTVLTLRKGNNGKAWLLLAGLSTQLVAVLTLAAAVIVLLASAI
ncbi:hypothetical protein [Streptomyces spiramyceticus]|uniref:hypothetical protein n=1 Tax=Streptomyces spiramyceticus TaxID=299717 RepID=UPI00237C1C65|nr:hypothetical protein [Streptomyces spiramyceticus]